MFTIVFIVILFKLFAKAKTTSTNNSTEHMFNVFIFHAVSSVFFVLCWLILENVFDIRNVPSFSVLVMCLLSTVLPQVVFYFFKKAYIANLSVSSSPPSIFPFLTIPLSYMLTTVFYVINQSSDHLVNMDIIGPIFHAARIPLSNPIAGYILYYLIAETIVIFTHIALIYNGSDNRKTYDIYCEESHMISHINNMFYPNYKCLSSINIDTNLLSMLVKTFFLIVYSALIFKYNRPHVSALS